MTHEPSTGTPLSESLAFVGGMVRPAPDSGPMRVRGATDRRSLPRRWLLVGGAVISLGLGVPGTALATGPTVIGFDDLAVGDPVADQYSATDGVRFGSVLTFGATLPGFNGCGAPSVAAAVSAASAPNAAQAPRCDTPGGFAEGTLAAFSFPRRTVSVKISSGASASPVTARLVAYNAAGVAVATMTGVLVNLRVTLSVSRPSADVAYAAISFDAPVDTTTPLQLDDLVLDNSAAPLVATGTTFAAITGTPFDGVVTRFTDADLTAVPGDFTASVAWGDASSASTGTIAADGATKGLIHRHRRPHLLLAPERLCAGRICSRSPTAAAPAGRRQPTSRTHAPAGPSGLTGVLQRRPPNDVKRRSPIKRHRRGHATFASGRARRPDRRSTPRRRLGHRGRH